MEHREEIKAQALKRGGNRTTVAAKATAGRVDATLVASKEGRQAVMASKRAEAEAGTSAKEAVEQLF